MSILKIRNLAFIKSIPEFGVRIAEALQDVQKGVGIIAKQTNSDPSAQPQAPPNLQNLSVTANDGHFNFSIQDQSPGLRRGVSYFVEHADNPSFQNSHTIELGQTRNHNEYLGNVTRYVRAYSAYAGSPPSQHVYFGGQTAPQAVQGGGSNAGPMFLPSQGTGTGAAGQGGQGPGPIPERTENSGFNWNLQRAQGSRGGFEGAGTPAGSGASDTGGSGGSGGGSPVVQAPLYDTYANWTAVKYPPAQYPLNTTFTITNWNFVTYIVRIVGGMNKWVYESGMYQEALASLPTTGFNAVALGANDAGLKFYANAVYFHIWQWSGSGWIYGPGNDRPAGETALFGADPGGGWHLADGTAQSVSAPNATASSVTLPDEREFYLFLSATYTGTGVPAASPPATNSGGGYASPTTTNALAGAGVAAITSLGSFTEPTIAFNSPPVPTFALKPYYRL